MANGCFNKRTGTKNTWDVYLFLKYIKYTFFFEHIFFYDAYF